MFKRANKITALLVAAASVMSIVPAMAADSTSSKLESKDGTITNAVAFQDGKYVYQGYKSDDDTDSVYYNGGSKDKELDDLSDATLNGSYADKYAFANDGSDQYLVDLSSGDVSDDITPVDDADTAATKLQTKLKKTDRYGSDLTSLTSDTNLGATSADDSNAALPGTKFGDSWYSYKIFTTSSDADNYVANGRYLYGFTDATGKYIDASYLANIYAYSSKQGKTVKIEDYSNNIDDVDDDSALLATLVGQPVVLTQDKDYLYALVHVAITDNSGYAKATAATTTTAAVTGTKTGAITTMRTYVQKIAKAQGDQKDDAYLPKTVESYEVGNTNDEYDCGDAGDAYDAVKAALGKNPEDLTIAQSDAVTTEDNGSIKAKFTTVNGNLIAIVAASDSIKAETLLFKKDKVKFEKTPGYKSATGTWNSDTKVDAYFVEKDSDDSVDIDVTSGDEYGTYDIDVDGNLWVVADGKIYEYTSGEMTKKFATDSSMDSLSVYDENNIIAWENNGDIYTTVAEGKAADTTVPATTLTTGWSQAADGTWNFFNATGTKVVSNWAIDGGNWYYLDANGTMATGWQYVGGTWYYLNPISDGTRGAMKTGWQYVDGNWYYLNPNSDGTKGAVKTGWQYVNSKWYYLNPVSGGPLGAMLVNTTVNGYVVGSDGAMI